MNKRETTGGSSVAAELRAQALEWVLEREAGFSAERAQAFQVWCARDPRHAAAVAQVERGVKLLGRMPEARDEIETRLEFADPGRATRRRVAWARRAAWATGLAATLMLAVLLGWRIAYGRTISQRVVTKDVVERAVALADGSVLNVNAASDLEVRLTARERRVTLHAGEAHFAVAHDRARPFIVTVGGVRVRAVGTAFNVRASEDGGVDVLVFEGRVEVTREGERRERAEPPPLVGAGERVRLRASEMEAARQIERVDAAALRDALAWHRLVTFASVPLRDVVAQFNAYNAIRVTIADRELAERRIGGTFALDRLEALLHLLEQEGDIAIDRSVPGAVTLRKAK